DNQAAIKSLVHQRPQPSQALIRLFYAILRSVKQHRKSLRLHLAWVPGHDGVEGNEVADEIAKGAASCLEPSSDLPPRYRCLYNPPRSQAAAKADFKRHT